MTPDARNATVLCSEDAAWASALLKPKRGGRRMGKLRKVLGKIFDVLKFGRDRGWWSQKQGPSK